MRTFVSYRRRDWPFVHPLVEQLKQYIYGGIFIDYRNIDVTAQVSSDLSSVEKSSKVRV